MKIVALLLFAFVCIVQDTPKAADQTKPPASQPSSQPASSPSSGRTPEQAGVLKELLRSVDRPAITTPEPIRSSEPSPVVRKDDALQPEGTALIERLGRLVRSGERSEFKFAPQDGKAVGQIEILPNSWLEYMEKEADSGASEFIITAELTTYRGRNFLLLRTYRRQVSHGNLSP